MHEKTRRGDESKAKSRPPELKDEEARVKTVGSHKKANVKYIAN